MIPLPHKIRKNGFYYVQVLRGERSFIYEQRITPEIKYYEVFELRIQPAKTFPSGKSYPAKEKFPGNEDFGEWAWSCRTYERAYERYLEFEKCHPS